MGVAQSLHPRLPAPGESVGYPEKSVKKTPNCFPGGTRDFSELQEMAQLVEAIEFRQTRKALLAESNGSVHLAECRCAELANWSRTVACESPGSAFSTGLPSIASRWHAKPTEIESITEIGAERNQSARESAGRKRQPFGRTASHFVRRQAARSSAP